MTLSALETRLCGGIAARHAALLDDLRVHVALPTGMNHTPGLDETRGLLTRRLGALGAQTRLAPGVPKDDWLYDSGADADRTPPPTAVCLRHRDTARCAVLLSGHLDTVHGPHGPFRGLTVAADGKTATGPGCVDMKGGLVIAVHALEALEEAGIAASWGFVMNSDEETGSYHSDATLREEAAAGYGAGLALEPAMADGGLVVQRPGSGQFMLETTGIAAHVGRDFRHGVSAIVSMAECIQNVHAMADPDRGIIANVGIVRGGTATNVVPDRAQAWGNVRFPTPEQGAELDGALRGMARDSVAGVRVRTSFNRPAKPLTPATERLALMARAAAEDLGQQLPFGKTGGVCDGNNLQAAGLPTIDTLGIRGEGLHTPTEWIELASLVERCQLLAVLIARLSERGFAA